MPGFRDTMLAQLQLQNAQEKEKQERMNASLVDTGSRLGQAERANTDRANQMALAGGKVGMNVEDVAPETAQWAEIGARLVAAKQAQQEEAMAAAAAKQESDRAFIIGKLGLENQNKIGLQGVKDSEAMRRQDDAQQHRIENPKLYQGTPPEDQRPNMTMTFMRNLANSVNERIKRITTLESDFRSKNTNKREIGQEKAKLATQQAELDNLRKHYGKEFLPEAGYGDIPETIYNEKDERNQSRKAKLDAVMGN